MYALDDKHTTHIEFRTNSKHSTMQVGLYHLYIFIIHIFEIYSEYIVQCVWFEMNF